MSGRARQFVGTILTVAGSVIPGLNLITAAVLIGGGMALSMSGARSEAREAQRRARAAQNSLAIRGNVRGTHEHHLLVFGKARVGGIIVAEGTLAGPDMPAQYFFLGVAHSICHEGGCEGYEAVWIDDTRIPAADIDDVTGEVTAGPYAGLVRLTHYRGTGTQAADPDLTANNLDYSTAYRRGIQWTLARFKRTTDADAFINAFKGRFPILNVESNGIRCYDPRKDSTNGGSGAHRYTDVLTWEWTDNFILQAATFSIMKKLHGGEGIPPENIVWPTVAAAANVADELITTPAGQQKRFRGNGVLVSHDKNSVNLQKILDAGQGKRVEVGGMFEFHCSSWRTPTFTIDHTWLAGPVEILPRGRLESNYNFVRVNFNDAAQDYKTIEAPPYVNAAYEAEDGGERAPRDLNLPMVSDKYQAQYNSQILGKKSRDQYIIEFSALNMKALDVKPWETGEVVLPDFPELAGKYFRIEHWATGANGVSAVLEEDKASNYDVEAFQTPVTGDAPVISIEGTMPPTNVAAVAVADGIRITWTPPPAHTFNTTEIYRSNNAINGFVSIDEVARRGSYYIDGVTDGATWYYKLAARTNFGTYSGFSAVVSATAKQAADGSSQLGNNLGFESGGTGWSADSGRWAAVQESPRTGSWSAKFTSTGGAVTDVFRNSKKFPVSPGDLVFAYGYLVASAGADGTANWRIAWLDSAGAEISTTNGAVIAPTTTYSQSRLSSAAPAGAAYARLEVLGANISVGSWWADDGYCVITPKSQDEIPDGTIYGRTRQTALTSGEVDLSKSGVIQKSADYIAEAATRKWAAESGANITETRVSADTTNVSGKSALSVKNETEAFIKNAKRVDFTLDSGVDAMPLWVRVVTLTGGNGRGSYEVELTTGTGGSAVPATEKYFVSVDWTGQATISKIGAGESSSLLQVRVVGDYAGGGACVNSHFDAQFTISGSSGVVAIVRPSFESGALSVPMSKSPAAPSGNDVTTTLVYDEATRYGATARYGQTTRLPARATALTNGEVDLSLAGVISRTADYISEAATRKWAAESGAQVVTGKSLTVLVDRNLANIDDTTYWRRAPSVYPDSLVANGNFAASDTVLPPPGWAQGASGPIGFQLGTGTMSYQTGNEGPRALRVVNDNAFAGVQYGSPFTVIAGEQYTYRMTGRTSNPGQYMNSFLRFFNAANTAIGDSTLIQFTDITFTANAATITVPANAVYAVLLVYNDGGNTAGQWFEVDNVTVRKVYSADDDLRDGTIYQRTKATALTSGEVDMTKSGVLNRTADYITESGSRKWAGESGATVGAVWGGNITSQPVDTDILNTHLQGNVLVVNHPAGGNVAYNASNQTGAFKIQLPVSWTDTMLRLFIEVYEYATNKSMTLEVGGYTNPGNGGEWLNVYAKMTGSVGASKAVRFGHDGTKCCVWIGEPTDTWQYPQVTVTNVRAGFAAHTAANWKAGWAVALDTSAHSGHSVTATVSNPLTGAFIDELQESATYGRTKLTALTSGEVDMTKSGVLNRTADYIAEATTRKWAAESGANITETRTAAAISGQGALATKNAVDLATAEVTNKNLGNIADDATYGRTKLTALTSGEVDLTKSGVLNRNADNIAEATTRKWAAESGADVTSGKSVNVLTDVKTVAQFFTFTQTLFSGTSVTIPTGANLCIMRAWGGCGGGARVVADASHGAGGGGGGVKKTVIIKSSDHNGTISYAVGSGGAAGPSAGTNGSAGTATTITSTGLSFTNLNISAAGGAGGTTAAGGAGGGASGGDTNLSGSAGTFGTTSTGGAHASIDSISPGKGGNGNDGPAQAGSNGQVTFTWEG